MTSNDTVRHGRARINSASWPVASLGHPADHRDDVARILSAKAENRPANV
jgi:hypothetical protein